MNLLLYEDHRIMKKDFPFIFHTDTVTKNLAQSNWHANMEFLCCIQGKGVVMCDTQEHPFTEGDIIAVNPDVVHHVSSDTAVVYHCLVVDTKFFADNSLDSENLCFQELIQDPEVFAAYQKIAEAVPADTPYRNAQVKYAVLGFLLLLCQKYECPCDRNKARLAHSQRIKNTLKYIQQNIASDLTLEKIAAFAGVSQCYLSREFKKYTTHTIFEYINIQRCREAKRLIHEGMSVSSAARSCGFENMSYFSRTYKKYMGILPSQQER